jgi:hypothetical protein
MNKYKIAYFNKILMQWQFYTLKRLMLKIKILRMLEQNSDKHSRIDEEMCENPSLNTKTWIQGCLNHPTLVRPGVN